MVLIAETVVIVHRIHVRVSSASTLRGANYAMYCVQWGIVQNEPCAWNLKNVRRCCVSLTVHTDSCTIAMDVERVNADPILASISHVQKASHSARPNIESAHLFLMFAVLQHFLYVWQPQLLLPLPLHLPLLPALLQPAQEANVLRPLVPEPVKMHVLRKD